jgi:RNA polymerase sigma-70 factor, ECF subfamily
MAPMPAQRTGIDASDVTDGHRPQATHRAGPAVTSRDVRAALAALSAEHRQVIVEIYYHHRSVAETADVLGIRPSSVVSLAYSAVRQLPHTLAVVASPRAPSPRPATAFVPSAASHGRTGSAALQRRAAS